MNKTSDQIANHAIYNIRTALEMCKVSVVSQKDYEKFRNSGMGEDGEIFNAPRFINFYGDGKFKVFVVASVEEGVVWGHGLFDAVGETGTKMVEDLTAEEVLEIAPYLPIEFLSFPLYHVVAIEGEVVKALKTYTEECPDLDNTFLGFVVDFGIEGDTDELLMDGIAINNSAQNSVVMYNNQISARHGKKVDKRREKTVYALHNRSDGDDRRAYYVGLDVEKLKSFLRKKQIPAGASSVTYDLGKILEYTYFTQESVIEDGSPLHVKPVEEAEKTVEVVLVENAFYFTDPAFDYDKVQSFLYDL